MAQLETEIAEWRAFVGQAPAIDVRDVEELEAHLRASGASTRCRGSSLASTAAGSGSSSSSPATTGRTTTRSAGGPRHWRSPSERPSRSRSHVWSPASPEREPSWLFRDAGLFVLPFLAGWLVRRRRVSLLRALRTAVAFAVAALVIKLYPFRDDASTEALAALHPSSSCGSWSPTPTWGNVAVARAAHGRRPVHGRVVHLLRPDRAGRRGARRTDRGHPRTDDPGRRRAGDGVGRASGAAGGVVVAAWLVESKQRVVENMAPVFTMLFTPVFAVMLVGAALVYAVTGLDGAFDRELLSVFDALMVVVLGLVLYGMSARDPSRPPGWMDRIQLVAVASALLLDVMVLGSMVARIGDLEFTPN